MDNPLFIEVREAITKWIKSSYMWIRNKSILIEILKDDTDCLRVELNFGEILAEILVEESNFAPYHYVSFQAVEIKNGVLNLLHFWYDKDGMSIEQIIKNLDEAITFVWERNNCKGTTII